MNMNPGYSPEPSRTLYLTAWVTLFFQVFLPLTVAFSPVFARADTSGHFFSEGYDHQRYDTKPYTLKDQETVSSVARQYNITPDELRKLNQFRTFAHGFDNLRAGDELDVPSSPATGKQTAKTAAATQLKQMAGLASGTGALLTEAHDSDAITSRARGLATSEVGSAATQWLNTFGTARVQLDADKDFSLKNSQFDFLLPLADSPDDLFFIQNSLHRTDDRTQANLGSGIRWFANDYMLGGNTFIDYDLSRDHARMGLGVEYWRDYLKLGANDYLRLTGWKDSPDMDNYEERPANGWDIRAEGYLPAYPQLGGKLTYEQYYGASVALFDKDNLQKNPNAVTFGLTWTPVPLVTFSADERQGKGGQNDSRIGLQLQWRPGMSWSQQLSSDDVSSLRRLSSSRYDFVERNNDIVLEYKEKDGIVLKTATALSGYISETKSLGVSVKSSDGVQGIEWSAPELLAYGGKVISAGGNNYSVILPSDPATEGRHYTITGVAIDRKGHRSSPAYTQLSVNAPQISTSYSTFTPADSQLAPDGTGKQILTLVLKDNQQKIVDEPATNVKMTTASTTSSQSSVVATLSSVVSPVTRTGAGTYIATVTAGSMPETVTLTPVVEGAGLDMHARIHITDTTPSSRSQFKAGGNAQAPADGSSSVSLTYQALDNSGRPVSGVADSLTFVAADSHGNPADSSSVMVESIKETPAGSGVYMSSLKGTLAGKYNVTPQFNHKQEGEAVEVTLTADNRTARIASGGLIAVTNNAVANGTDPNEVRATVTDAQGNLLSGQKVSFRVDDGAVLSASTVDTGEDGIAAVTLTSTTAGVSHVTASINGSSQVVDVSFTADNHSARIASGDLVVVTNNAVANGTDPNEVRATVTDAQGNPLSGQTVSFRVDDGAVLSASTVDTGGDGIAAVTLTSTTAGVSHVTASINGSSQIVSVDFTAEDAFIFTGGLTIVKNNAAANGTDPNEVKAKVTDNHGNPLSGQTVSFRADNGAVLSASTVDTGGDGIAAVTLTSTTAGVSHVTASINGSSQVVDVSFTAVGHDAEFASLTSAGENIAVSAGFPTTGFDGAKFKLNLPAGIQTGDFTWSSSDNNAVSVNAGEVTLNSTTHGTVTIKAAPNSGNGDTYSYTFTVQHWFTHGADFTWPSLDRATSDCAAQGGTVPGRGLLTNGSAGMGGGGTTGKVGSLFGEWGNMVTGYAWPGDVWSQEGDDVDLYSGWYTPGASQAGAVVCVRNT